MRYAAFALVAGLSACSLSSSGTGGECVNDQQCGDDVCARSGECLAPSSVRQVVVKWTMNGATADSATCAEHPNLSIQFNGSEYSDMLRFAPVPCRSGSFFVDHLPKRYVQVELGVEGAGHSADVAPIDLSPDLAAGSAQFDIAQ
jgi:hypothetical protein